MQRLPKAVQDQIDQADAIVEQMNTAPAGQADTLETEVPEAAPAPTAEEVIPQAQAPQPAEPVQAPGIDWETKYKVLQGKYNAEVPHLTQQVHELKSAMTDMQAQMKAAEKQRTQVDADSLVTDADREAFGADLVNLAERAAQKHTLKLQAEVEALRAANEELQARMARTDADVQVTGKQGFLDGLTRHLPDWEKLNEDPGFLKWLQEPDPVFGVERQEALDRAAATLNVKAAVAVFQAYLATVAPPAQPTKSPKDDLQRQVAPSRSRASVTPDADPAAGKIFTNDEISFYYSQIRQGVYTPEVAARIEADIDRAAAEGRVR